MIKVETLGMIEVAKVNPVLKADKDVANYSFITDDGVAYLVANTLTGDNAYREDVVIPAGEYLNGYALKAWEGQKLVIDGKHITGGVEDVTVGTVLVVADDGTLETLETDEATGTHLVVTDVDTRLTEKAVKAKIVVA